MAQRLIAALFALALSTAAGAGADRTLADRVLPPVDEFGSVVGTGGFR